MGIKIVRALWGDIDKFIDDIDFSSRINTIVMVWGYENYQKLTQMGFECELLSRDNMSMMDDSEMYHLKLIAMHEAALSYGSILFLDWDTKPLKGMDPHFEKTFWGKQWSAPLYCYPADLSKYAETDIEIKWGNMIDEMMVKHSWQFGDYNVIPMAGLIYISSPHITNQLLQIYYKHKMRGLIEEFALFELANCSIQHYLKNYEPSCIRGREYEEHFIFGSYCDFPYTSLNDYVGKLVAKDCYFTHE